MANKTIPDLNNIPAPSLDSLIEISEQTNPLFPLSGNISLRQLIELAQGMVTGSANYQDTATQSSPISGTSGAAHALTCNGLGTQSYDDLPTGVAQLWDASTDALDFTDLAPIDTVEIRIDVEVTTTSANQEVELYIDMAQGGFNYQIPLRKAVVKSAGANQIAIYTSLYMGDSNTVDNPAQIKLLSDGNTSTIVNGWFIKVLRKTF